MMAGVTDISPREREVLELVGQHLTDPEIGGPPLHLGTDRRESRVVTAPTSRRDRSSGA